jgi:hypothetical protein
MGKWEEIWRKREGEGEGNTRCTKTDKRRQKGLVFRVTEHESAVRRQEQVKKGCKKRKEWRNGRKFGGRGEGGVQQQQKSTHTSLEFDHVLLNLHWIIEERWRRWRWRLGVEGEAG